MSFERADFEVFRKQQTLVCGHATTNDNRVRQRANFDFQFSYLRGQVELGARAGCEITAGKCSFVSCRFGKPVFTFCGSNLQVLAKCKFLINHRTINANILDFRSRSGSVQGYRKLKTTTNVYGGILTLSSEYLTSFSTFSEN